MQVLEVDAVVKHTVKIPTAEKRASEAKKLTFITDTSIQKFKEYPILQPNSTISFLNC